MEIKVITRKLLDFLSYDPAEPFVFTSLDFWLFFGLFLATYSVSYSRNPWRNLTLLVFSLFFYYKASGYAVILLILTISFDYMLAGWMPGRSKRKQFWLVTTSIVSNLLLLAYFKYAYFLVNLGNDWLNLGWSKQNWLALLLPHHDLLKLDTEHILLPVGISFFVFQSLSYTIDVYRGIIEPIKKWSDYAVFACFFPQLVAGPIVRAKDFLPQIFKPYSVDREMFGNGVYLILGGLFKKIVISDILSTQLVDRVFDNPELSTPLESWLATYGYGIQIFCDFSGYTDIAIGVALILGFHLNPNFDQPYKSINITEFWRRWHISLSVWLRDYLYIPLGGNRNGTFRTYLNLFITMLLGGLWHGASLKFLFWGGMHGLALALHKLWMELAKKWSFSMPSALAWLLTFHFALFCWLPFRAGNWDLAVQLFQNLWKPWDQSLVPAILIQYRLPVSILGLGFFPHFLPDYWKTGLQQLFSRSATWKLALVSIVLVLVIYQFKTAESQPFIYFQF